MAWFGEELNVMLAMRNEIGRYGLERMLMTLPRVGKVEVRNSLEDGRRGLRDGTFDVLIAALSELESRQFTLPPGSSATKTLLVMDCSNPDDIVEAANTVVNGFVDINNLRASSLDEALHKLEAGEISIPAKLMSGLLADVRNRNWTEHVPPTTLTPREQEVLSLLVQGLSNKQIARQLTISSHGVKRLVSSILAKLNCPNRTLAVAKALRNGLRQERIATGPRLVARTIPDPSEWSCMIRRA